MRKGRCGEYSAPQSAALQSAVQPRPWARTTLDLELLKPPSSLSFSLSWPKEAWGPFLSGRLDGGWPGAVVAGGAERLGPCPHPTSYWTTRRPGRQHPAALSSSIQQQALSPANTAAPIASYTPLFRMHLDLFRKGDFWTGLCSFSFCKCRWSTDFLSLIKREGNETFDEGNPQRICLVCAQCAWDLWVGCRLTGCGCVGCWSICLIDGDRVAPGFVLWIIWPGLPPPHHPTLHTLDLPSSP